MTPLRKLQPFTLPLTVGGTRIDIAGLRRDGTGEPLLFLHGFGSTKEDYADVIHQHDLADRPILAYDAPGCGASTCSDLSALSIPFLVSVATEVLDAQRIERYHLIGHSMGGLTALMLADQNPTRVASFVNIEGNIAPEDCFLSRQVISHAHGDPASSSHCSPTGSASPATTPAASTPRPCPTKSGPPPLSPSSSPWSPCPTTATSSNASSPYPRRSSSCTATRTTRCPTCNSLDRNGVELAEISHSAHFPMYSNPPEMWRRITQFIKAHASEIDA